MSDTGSHGGADQRRDLEAAIDRMQRRLDTAFDLAERFEIEVRSARELYTAGYSRLSENLGPELGLGATDLGTRSLLAELGHRTQAEHAARWLRAKRNHDRARYLVVGRRRALRAMQASLRELEP